MKKDLATTPEHKPFIPDDVTMPEFTWSAVLVGAVLGIIFGASSLYLVLKVGMTVSASIPVAVLSITLFRVLAKLPFFRRATILENNIVQTTGSAGESIAFGVGVTMPALMILGFEMDVGRVLVVSVLGGLLGILMMIPLRRAFIVKKHGELKYPEGTACADVLIVGEQGGSSARTVFVGFGIAFVFQFARLGLKLFEETVAKSLSWFKGAVPAMETDPTLLGVGYIIGTRISCIMMAGGVLAAMVLTPAIHFFGDGLKENLFPGTKPISQMSSSEIRGNYVLYIGAGAVAAGGIISLFQALPLIIGSLRSAVRDIGGGRGAAGSNRRTDRDLPLSVVGIGSILLVIAVYATTPLHAMYSWVPELHMNPLGAALIVVFGFLFVTVSSRLTGEIGSSSNPISGMTVATLLLTCLIFWAMDWRSVQDQVTALSVAAVVCIASSNGGTTSQDLKTGFLVGATPKWQQLAILVGALSSALVIGYVLILINDANTIYSKKDIPAPKVPISVQGLKETAKAPNDDQIYHVLRVEEGNEYGLPTGEWYLVNDQGQIVYMVDPGINGTRKRRDDGTEVQRFDAPKARLMALITGGVLKGNLPWNLVLLGVFIAIVLELSGIPSLAFAVGVYLPLATSAPIFVGGMVRYAADHWSRRSSAEPISETESDSSPGVLLSTGYIAGGAIAGVLVAFLNLSESIPKQLATWQYTKLALAKSGTLEEASRALARERLGFGDGPLDAKQTKELEALADEIAELNEDIATQYVQVPADTELRLPGGDSFKTKGVMTLGQIAEEKLNGAEHADGLLELNLDRLIRIPKGTELTLPANRPAGAPEKFTTDKEMTLGDAAKQALGDSERARQLYNVNKDKLQPNVLIPAGLKLMKVPQQTWPAMVAFGVLIVLLLLVGLGWWLRSETTPSEGSHLS